MSSYRSRSVHSKTKARHSPKRPRRPRREVLEVAPSHPMPTEVQLTMALPEFMDDLRAFLFGKINNTIVDAIEKFLEACACTVAGEKHQGQASASQI